MSKELIDAIKSNDAKKVSELLESASVDINYKDENGRTPLIHAVMSDNVELVKKLVERGTDITVIDSEGFSVLAHCLGPATEERSLYPHAFEMADIVLKKYEEKKAEAEKLPKAKAEEELKKLTDHLNYPGAPIEFVAQMDLNIPIKYFNKLRDLGADINHQGGAGFTPLMYAVERQDPIYFEELLKAGKGQFNFKIQNDDRNTVLHEALIQNQKEIAKLLLAEPSMEEVFLLRNSSNLSPIDLIIIAEDKEMIGVLLSKYSKNPEMLHSIFDQIIKRDNKELIDLILSDKTHQKIIKSKILIATIQSNDVKRADELLRSGEIDLNDAIPKESIYAIFSSAKPDIIKLLLDKGWLQNIQYEDLRLLIITAMSKNWGDITDRLLHLKSASEEIEKDNNGKILLRFAIQYDQENAYSELMKYKLDFSKPFGDGETLLTFTAKRGNLNKVSEIIAKGANINDVINGHNIFHLIFKVLESKYTESEKEFYGAAINFFIESLINAGKDVKSLLNQKDSYGNTPLMYAIQYGGDIDLIKNLVEKGASLNIKSDYGMTPLMNAIYQKNEPLILFLLSQKETKESINITNYDKQSALAIALRNDLNINIINAILEANPNINQLDSNGFSILTYAFGYSSPEVLKRIVEFPGINLLEKDLQGLTPLMRAIETGRREIVNYLLSIKEVQEKSHIDAVSADGMTALTRAIRFKQFELIDDILKVKPDLEIPYCGYPAIFLALADPSTPLNTLLSLLKAGADIKTLVTGNYNILHLALNYNRFDFLSLLLEQKDIKEVINQKNSSGYTALQLAMTKLPDNDEGIRIIEAMVKNGANLLENDEKLGNALMISISEAKPNIMNYILRQPNVKDIINSKLKSESIQTTALSLAAVIGNIELMERLIALGASLKETYENNNSILLKFLKRSLPSKEETQKMVDYLITKGVDVLAKNDQGENAFYELIEQKLDYMKLANTLSQQQLFEAFSQQDNKGISPFALLLQTDAKNFMLLFSKLSKEQQMDVLKQKSKSGLTFLHHAITTKNVELSKLFIDLQKVEDLETKDKEGKTPLITALLSNNPEIVRELIAKGVNVKEMYDKKTVLQYLFEMGSYDLCANILSKKSNADFLLKKINATDSEGKTLLMTLLENLQEFKKEPGSRKFDQDPKPLIKMLIAEGADVNVVSRYGSPLIYAIKANDPELIEMILSKDKEKTQQFINNKNKDDQTALILAVINNDKDLVQKLLTEYNVKLEMQDKFGKTAMMYAQAAKDPTIANLLKSKGAILDVAADPLSEMHDRGDAEALINAVKKNCEAIEKEPLLLAGPLIYNQYTSDLEKIVLSILEGVEVKVTGKKGEDYKITLNRGDKPEEYNLTEILKYANWQHIRFSKGASILYQDYVQTSTVKPSYKMMSQEDYQLKHGTGPLKNVNFGEAQAINIYTGGSYKQMVALQSGRLDKIPESQLVEFIVHSAMCNSGLNQIDDTPVSPKHVFRLETADSSHMQAKIGQRIEQIASGGGVILESSFMSTSTEKPVSTFYKGGETNVRITLAKGIMGKYIADISQFPDEREVLIPGSTQILWVGHRREQIKENLWTGTVVRDMDHLIGFPVRTITNLPENAKKLANDYSQLAIRRLAVDVRLFINKVLELEKIVAAYGFDPAISKPIYDLMKRTKELLANKDKSPAVKLGLMMDDVEKLRALLTSPESDRMTRDLTEDFVEKLDKVLAFKVDIRESQVDTIIDNMNAEKSRVPNELETYFTLIYSFLNDLVKAPSVESIMIEKLLNALDEKMGQEYIKRLIQSNPEKISAETLTLLKKLDKVLKFKVYIRENQIDTIIDIMKEEKNRVPNDLEAYFPLIYTFLNDLVKAPSAESIMIEKLFNTLDEKMRHEYIKSLIESNPEKISPDVLALLKKIDKPEVPIEPIAKVTVKAAAPVAIKPSEPAAKAPIKKETHVKAIVHAFELRGKKESKKEAATPAKPKPPSTPPSTPH